MYIINNNLEFDLIVISKFAISAIKQYRFRGIGKMGFTPMGYYRRQISIFVIKHVILKNINSK